MLTEMVRWIRIAHDPPHRNPMGRAICARAGVGVVLLEDDDVSDDNEHSPIPWSVEPVLAFGEYSIRSGNKEIGFLYSSDGADELTPFPAKANANLIVTAVNAHDPNRVSVSREAWDKIVAELKFICYESFSKETTRIHAAAGCALALAAKENVK